MTHLRPCTWCLFSPAQLAFRACFVARSNWQWLLKVQAVLGARGSPHLALEKCRTRETSSVIWRLAGHMPVEGWHSRIPGMQHRASHQLIFADVWTKGWPSAQYGQLHVSYPYCVVGRVPVSLPFITNLARLLIGMGKTGWGRHTTAKHSSLQHFTCCGVLDKKLLDSVPPNQVSRRWVTWPSSLVHEWPDLVHWCMSDLT